MTRPSQNGVTPSRQQVTPLRPTSRLVWASDLFRRMHESRLAREAEQTLSRDSGTPNPGPKARKSA